MAQQRGEDGGELLALSAVEWGERLVLDAVDLQFVSAIAFLLGLPIAPFDLAVAPTAAIPHGWAPPVLTAVTGSDE